jgi:hypothetical protein
MHGNDLRHRGCPSGFGIPWEAWAFWLASLLALLPLWLPALPPMADLPQHAAQVALFRDLWSGSSPWEGLLLVKWFTPYILGYAITIGLAEVFGVVVACKLVVSIAMLLPLWVTRCLLKAAGSAPAMAWLCIWGIYGFVYQWGMVSFMLAVPAGLFCIHVLAWHAVDPGGYRGVLLAAYFVGLFFCHALVLAFCCLIASVFWLSDLPMRGGVRHLLAWAWARLWPLLGVMVLAFLWLSQSSGHASVSVPMGWDLGWWQSTEAYYSSANWAFTHSAGWGRLSGLFPRVFGIRSELMAIILGVLLLATPFLLSQRMSYQRHRVAPFVALIICLVFVPSFVFGTAFVYQRYAIFFLPLYVLLFVPRKPHVVSRATQWLLIGLIAATLGWVTLFCARAIEFDREAQSFRQVTDQVQPHGRILSLVFNPDDEDSIAPTLLHFPTWLSATRVGLVDAGFTGTHIQLVVYRPGSLPRASVVEHFEWRPDRFNWQRHAGDQYDHFVVRSRDDLSRLLFHGAPCVPQLLAAKNGWWLYAKVVQCGK